MKHKRTTRKKKYKGDELDTGLKGWTYGGKVAREVTLRAEYRARRKAKDFTDY